MIYKSEITGKEYKTEKECLQAEKEHEAKVANVSRRKKELADVISKAEEKVSEANKLYEIAEQRAAELLEKSNKEIKEILEVAEKQVKEAEKEKLDAVIAFNKEFGAYTTKYTGEKAADEFSKSLARFNRLFRDLFTF